MNGRSVETTFFWFIENYSYSWHKFGEYLRSPSFSAYDPENTSWWIALYPRGQRYVSRGYISLFLARNPTDEGQENVSVKFELSILAADGSIIHSETKKETFENNDTSGFEEFLPIDSFYKDILTVRCRLWKGDGKTQESAPICARNYIAIKNH
ncbi:unnamed protein product [Larinioides sclopetarius]|uniref:MATH domain-containing protein n=1 Tax=Larinioides sclopetarius TaxID=280406 RepID=A0AAV2B0Q8_9ARAC